jgi:NADPH:quinone reductase-like Zn-dependent oxidoreductase
MEAAPVSNTPGVDMIGKIDKIDALSMLKYKLKPGNRVMSLIKWGGNSRYTRIATDQLVKVPSGVDPAQAVCLAEAYLAAFQALHYTHSHNERYSNHSMIGRSILLIGAMTNVGRAVVELAKALGAMNVYAVGKERHHPMLTTLGVVPLRRDPKLWPAGIMGMMDLVIDATGDSAGDHATASHFCALHERGTLIFIGLRSMTDHVASEWDVSSPWFDADMVAQVINRTHALEVFDNWDLDLERSKVRNSQIIQFITVI